jgi:hypothetical protein
LIDITELDPKGNKEYYTFMTEHHNNGELKGVYPFIRHRIWRTDCLRSLANYKSKIEDALIKSKGTTKFNKSEDLLLLVMMNHLIFSRDVLSYENNETKICDWILKEHHDKSKLISEIPVHYWNRVGKVLNGYDSTDSNNADNEVILVIKNLN